MNVIKHSTKGAILGILLFVFFIVGTTQGCMGKETPAGGIPAVGSAAPDFTLTNLEGKSVRLSDLRGRIVFLNFWATWCPPCKEEMPSIESLKVKMSGEDFSIVAVSVDGVSSGEVRAYMNNNGYTFEVLHDQAQKIAETYLVTGIPTTFIIDKDGIIVEVSRGSESWDSIERLKQFRSLCAAQ